MSGKLFIKQSLPRGLWEKAQNKLYLEKISVLLQKELLVERFQKVHFQIISQLRDLLLELEKSDPCAYSVCKFLLTLSWVADIHPIQWKLFTEMKFLCNSFLLAILLSIRSSPLSLSCKKWCKCKEARLGCMTFLKFVNTLYQAVVFLLTASCCRMSTIVSGPFCSPELMDGVQFWSP